MRAIVQLCHFQQLNQNIRSRIWTPELMKQPHCINALYRWIIDQFSSHSFCFCLFWTVTKFDHLIDSWFPHLGGSFIVLTVRYTPHVYLFLLSWPFKRGLQNVPNNLKPNLSFMMIWSQKGIIWTNQQISKKQTLQFTGAKESPMFIVTSAKRVVSAFISWLIRGAPQSILQLILFIGPKVKVTKV